MKFSIFKKKENNIVRNTLVIFGMLALFFLAYKASVEQASINFNPGSTNQNENNQSQTSGDNNTDGENVNNPVGGILNLSSFQTLQECGGHCVTTGYELGNCVQKGEEGKNTVNVGKCMECENCFCFCLKK